MRVKTASFDHSFDISREEAKRIQNELSARVDLSDVYSSLDEVSRVGGADVAFIDLSQHASTGKSGPVPGKRRGYASQGSAGKGSENEVLAIAVAVVLDARRLHVVEAAFATAPALFPYIPGLLTFREGPAILAAIGELSELPGVMLYDGTGIAHPRGLGLASHMAMLNGIPSIGCAKSLLVGSCDEPGNIKGNRSYQYYRNRVVGTCLRTREGVKPVYVSPGSGFSVDGACNFVLSLTGKYRLPEPTRIAHNLVTAKKREFAR